MDRNLMTSFEGSPKEMCHYATA